MPKIRGNMTYLDHLLEKGIEEANKADLNEPKLKPPDKYEIRQPIRIQFGNHEEAITSSLSAVMKDVAGDRHKLAINSTWHGEDLEQIAKSDGADIYIFFANNITFRHSSKLEIDFGRIQGLIASIKEQTGSTVISMASVSVIDMYPESIEVVRRLSDHFFSMPFKMEDFVNAFEGCLDMLPE